MQQAEDSLAKQLNEERQPTGQTEMDDQSFFSSIFSYTNETWQEIRNYKTVNYVGDCLLVMHQAELNHDSDKKKQASKRIKAVAREIRYPSDFDDIVGQISERIVAEEAYQNNNPPHQRDTNYLTLLKDCKKHYEEILESQANPDEENVSERKRDASPIDDRTYFSGFNPVWVTYTREEPDALCANLQARLQNVNLQATHAETHEFVDQRALTPVTFHVGSSSPNLPGENNAAPDADDDADYDVSSMCVIN